jgi:argininosuccinate synthase
VLEDPWRAPDEEMFIVTQSPRRAPDEPVELLIGFEKGTPVSIDGEALSPARFLTRLNRVAATHGVGRVDMVENRVVGMKSRGVYETPGGTVLHVAHRAMESITMDREVMHERDRLSPRFAELIYNGFWFSPEMDVLRAAIDASQENVTGEVRVKLYKGNVLVTGRRSPVSLYSEALGRRARGHLRPGGRDRLYPAAGAAARTLLTAEPQPRAGGSRLVPHLSSFFSRVWENTVLTASRAVV